MRLVGLVLFLLGLNASLASAMEQETYKNLIERLESSLSSVQDRNTRHSIQLRLGDLYADQARLVAIKEVESSCNDCLGSKSLRLKAIANYQASYDGAQKEDLPRILLQIAHLYGLTGQIDKAELVFKNVIKDKARRSAELVGESYAGLGEIQFHKGQFGNAKRSFQNALRRPLSKPGQVKHRLAWCYFNEGQTSAAVTMISSSLKADELTNDLRMDMSKDLATFVARQGINKASIDLLLELSPENVKKSNLFYLGQEADRLGRREGALLVWATYTSLGNVSEDESMEILLRTAQNLIDENAKTGSLQHYERFYSQFGSRSCKPGTVCDDLQARSRSYVTNWIKKEKTEPSSHLLSALKIYTRHNTSDVEMLQWAGHVAKYNRKYADATTYYRNAADEAFRQLKGSPHNRSWLEKSMQASLLAEVEMAEDSEKNDLKRQAYNHYLELSPQSKKTDEIRYQLAYLDYQEKNLAVAAKSFHSLAVASTLSNELKVKSAHLSLDALGQLKKQKEVETQALAYGTKFKNQRQEFSQIARRAGVNIAVELFASQKMNESAAKESLKKLKSVNLIGATETEKAEIYKNQIAMAEAAKELNEVDKAAVRLLGLKNLSATDKEYGLDRRLWVSEAQMKFAQAYSIAKSMRLSTLPKDKRHLKLALLADLAGRNSRPHYEAYIKMTPSRAKANLIRAKFIRESKRPWQTLEKYKWKMLSTPSLYADVLVDVFAKDFNEDQLQKHLKIAKIRRTESGQILQGILDMTEFYDHQRNIGKSRLVSKNDRTLQKSIQERIRLLKNMERKADWALSQSSFRTQLSYIDLISREYRRLYMDLMGLPVPRGLKKAEANQYRRLLEDNAKPFLDKSKVFEGQFKELADKSKAFAVMLDSADKVKLGHSTLLRFELNSLKKRFGDKGMNRRIDRALSSIRTPNHRQIVKLQNEVISNPFDLEKIEQLKNLEELRGRSSMVAFLEARLTSSQKGTL